MLSQFSEPVPGRRVHAVVSRHYHHLKRQFRLRAAQQVSDVGPSGNDLLEQGRMVVPFSAEDQGPATAHDKDLQLLPKDSYITKAMSSAVGQNQRARHGLHCIWRTRPSYNETYTSLTLTLLIHETTLIISSKHHQVANTSSTRSRRWWKLQK